MRSRAGSRRSARRSRTPTSDYDKEKLQERLAKLAGGVAVIKVGGSSEIEVKERKDRVDDALHATRAAVEEGIVPGGGTALLYATKALEGMTGVNDDQTRGIDIVRRALQSPIRQIAENAGHDGAVVAGKLIDGNDETLGFNAQTEVYENLVTAGVIDPTKVVRTALQDAASVAGLLITTEAAVSELPEDKPAMPACRRRRHGRHGRHGLLSPGRSGVQSDRKGRGGDAPALFYCALPTELPGAAILRSAAPLAGAASSSGSAAWFRAASSAEVSNTPLSSSMVAALFSRASSLAAAAAAQAARPADQQRRAADDGQALSHVASLPPPETHRGDPARTRGKEKGRASRKTRGPVPELERQAARILSGQRWSRRRQRRSRRSRRPAWRRSASLAAALTWFIAAAAEFCASEAAWFIVSVALVMALASAAGVLLVAAPPQAASAKVEAITTERAIFFTGNSFS